MSQMLHWLQRERYKKRKRKRLFICMHMCVDKRDRTVRRTWLLGAPGAQSQRQNTDREIHSRHTPPATISLYLPPPHCLTLRSSLDLSPPISGSLHHFYIWFMHTPNTHLPQSMFPILVNILPVNITLFNPSQILLPTILPRLTAHLTSFALFLPSLNAC